MRRRFEEEKIDRKVVNGIFDILDTMKEQGYEEREGQSNMALDISEALRDGDNLIVEAGVGIGKTFAYLFPVMLYIKYMYKPVVIATSTIHLTEQLEQDVSDAEEIIKHKVSTIVGKGQKNYFCEKRAQQYKPKHDNDPIKKYIDEYPNSKINLSKKDFDKVNVNKCVFDQCKYRFNCDFYNMRKGLQGVGKLASNLIIVNQDILIMNYIKEERTGNPLINRNHDVVIIDEAHNLEEKARNALTKSYSLDQLNNIISQVERVSTESYKEFKYKINDMYNDIGEYIKANRPEEVESSRSSFQGNYLNKHRKLERELQDIYDTVQIISVQSSKVSDELIEDIDDLVHLFSGLFNSSFTKNIYWAELTNNKVTISYAPDNIADKLKQLFFSQSRQFILTSATISAGEESIEYKYLRKSIGLLNPTTSESKPSPFPYNENSRIYLPDKISKYEDDNHIESLAERILELAIATNGRTLVLFTSKKEMEAVYNLLKKSENQLYNIIMQSKKSEKETLYEFRSTKGILLATGTYWEGLNIEGKDLTSLIIARLPFPVPDPVINNKAEKSKDSYNEVLFPEMIIKLRQGVGRLIRSAKDRGILSILDARLSKESDYKHKNRILQSLPIQNEVNSMEEIIEFLTEKK